MKARQVQTKTFNFDYSSDIDDQRYMGSFTTKKLSVADSAALGVRKAQLNGGMHHNPDKPGYGIDEDTDQFNGMVAHLQISITNAPKWWDLTQITDIGVVSEVYKEVILFENSFHDRKRGTANNTGSVDGKSESSSGNVPPSDNDGKPRAVVDPEVQDPFKL